MPRVISWCSHPARHACSWKVDLTTGDLRGLPDGLVDRRLGGGCEGSTTLGHEVGLGWRLSISGASIRAAALLCLCAASMVTPRPSGAFHQRHRRRPEFESVSRAPGIWSSPATALDQGRHQPPQRHRLRMRGLHKAQCKSVCSVAKNTLLPGLTASSPRATTRWLFPLPGDPRKCTH